MVRFKVFNNITARQVSSYVFNGGKKKSDNRTCATCLPCYIRGVPISCTNVTSAQNDARIIQIIRRCAKFLLLLAQM